LSILFPAENNATTANEIPALIEICLIFFIPGIVQITCQRIKASRIKIC
jgi:hypothetical protein